MSLVEEAEELLVEPYNNKYPDPRRVPLIYCRTAIFCSRIIAEAILAAAERVRVPYGSGRIGGR